MKKYLICCLMLATLSACANNSEESKKVKSKKEVQVNGENPGSYYNKLLYHTTGSCSAGTIYFHYLSSHDIRLENDPHSKQTIGKMELFLFKDGTFTANYEERVVEYLVPNGYAYNVTFRKALKGFFYILSNGQIDFEGIGTGVALTYNKQPGISVKFSLDLHKRGLREANTFLGMITSSGSKDLYDSVCKYKRR